VGLYWLVKMNVWPQMRIQCSDWSGLVTCLERGFSDLSRQSWVTFHFRWQG
jgi:hypothetical protein